MNTSLARKRRFRIMEAVVSASYPKQLAELRTATREMIAQLRAETPVGNLAMAK